MTTEKINLKDELAVQANRIKGTPDNKEDALDNISNVLKNNESKENKDHLIRLLRADEIECRISTINERGAALLLFKDARVDQRILDETFTPFGWKRSHQMIDGNLYCTVEIWDDQKQQWISKQDVGSASYAEQEKGQASDSFKRSCFNWGIGRELYTAPFIWISSDKFRIEQKNGKLMTRDRFVVSNIDYNDKREISCLAISIEKGSVVYEYNSHNRYGKPDLKKISGLKLSEAQKTRLNDELERTGVSMQKVLERYSIGTINDMTSEQYDSAMASLKKTMPKAS